MPFGRGLHDTTYNIVIDRQDVDTRSTSACGQAGLSSSCSLSYVCTLPSSVNLHLSQSAIYDCATCVKPTDLAKNVPPGTRYYGTAKLLMATVDAAFSSRPLWCLCKRPKQFTDRSCA
eukprot:2578809-Pleurochrysis_carterae.AAC.1